MTDNRISASNRGSANHTSKNSRRNSTSNTPDNRGGGPKKSGYAHMIADGGLSSKLPEDGDGSPSDPRVGHHDSNNTNSNELKVGNRGSHPEMEQDPGSDHDSPSVRSKKSPAPDDMGSQKSALKNTQIKGVQPKPRPSGETGLGLLSDSTPKQSEGGNGPQDKNDIEDNKSRMVGAKRKRKRRDEGGRNRLEGTNAEIPGSNMLGFDGDNSSGIQGAKSGRRGGKAAGESKHKKR
jgi:hypothetical protein